MCTPGIGRSSSSVTVPEITILSLAEIECFSSEFFSEVFSSCSVLVEVFWAFAGAAIAKTEVNPAATASCFQLVLELLGFKSRES